MYKIDFRCVNIITKSIVQYHIINFNAHLGRHIWCCKFLKKEEERIFVNAAKSRYLSTSSLQSKVEIVSKSECANSYISTLVSYSPIPHYLFKTHQKLLILISS